ncbi:substrate-binding periplasmic protein [Colwellia psychrerythraea]|uniref:ABC-type transporter, periplasmic subunit family 3 n=1 Tax=Colwellia psychrerythraea TaxID=28229 RepID=A0A099KIS1_COLPS|nr:transporter substrate-binding domain-containing protein [Colwellia psychrerythraea]KGJ90709.1 ABC-type transporter, periplasmic subunit family 3 [Colwellia psychrerythraea]
MKTIRAIAKITQIIFSIGLLVSLLSSNTLATENNLTVSYSQHGQQYTIQGEQTAQGYRFNAKSDKVLNLATLNWPPYISESVCNKGWVFQFTVALLVSKGYQVNIHFYPWARSVKMVEQGKMDILFPEYFIESSSPSDSVPGKKREELLVLSNKFSGGELSLLKRKGESFELKADLSNLKDKMIGVVRGYQNTPEFDAMMDSEQFSTIDAVDELQLMRLLVAKRVDLIVGDPKVFNFSVNYSKLSNNNKQALLNGVEQVIPALKYNHLYFAISKMYPKRHDLLDDINLALIEFQQSGETERFVNIGSGCKLDF